MSIGLYNKCKMKISDLLPAKYQAYLLYIDHNRSVPVKDAYEQIKSFAEIDGITFSDFKKMFKGRAFTQFELESLELFSKLIRTCGMVMGSTKSDDLFAEALYEKKQSEKEIERLYEKAIKNIHPYEK